MKTRCGYKFDTSVAKAAKLVTEYCPNFCPYCFSGKQNIEHWIVLCPAISFGRQRSLFNGFKKKSR